MANYTTGVVNRMQSVMRAADALMAYDVDHKIEAAQLVEFGEGITVANDVMAEFISDLAHLCDYHGQDFPAILDAAAGKYLEHEVALEPAQGAAES